MRKRISFILLLKRRSFSIIVFFLMTLMFFPIHLKAQNAIWICPNDTTLLEELGDFLVQNSIPVRVKSNWLHAISVDGLTSEERKNINKHFNCQFSAVLKLKSTSLSFVQYGALEKCISQMNGSAFIQDGWDGQGVKIGIADAGYLYLNDSNKMSALQHLWINHQIILTHDFVSNKDTIVYDELYYTGKKSKSKRSRIWVVDLIRKIKLIPHSHGTEVLKMMAGVEPDSSSQLGLASGGNYYLARTEDGVKEFKEEEDYYVSALEWMHQSGVRIVNTSLGYGKGRKLKGSNYSPLQMNGSSMISRAVQIACTEKNMLVIVAAGNDGDKRSWKVITTPADAKAALSVGAVLNKFEKAEYSSIGPEYNDYLKPEVAAFSENGTSLSAPAVSGFAACLLEMNPNLSAEALKDLIIRSSHLYPYGNNFIGYGVPLANRAIQLLAFPEMHFSNASEVHLQTNIYLIDTLHATIPSVTVFHKKNAVHVLKQEVLLRGKEMNRIIVKRPKNCLRSTVQIGYQIIELFWDVDPAKK